MIFHNPAGGPELGCNECGCRWFDRHTNSCYECGAEISQAEVQAYQQALAEFHADKGIKVNDSKSGENTE